MEGNLTKRFRAWYLIWESVLNILAELTYFADRSFYDTWWNSGTHICLLKQKRHPLTRSFPIVSWDQYARDWNRPVHNFLLRHVYHSSISFMKVNKHVATLITFLLSACVHELVMWCIFKKLRGYLLMMQMCQLPVSAEYTHTHTSTTTYVYLLLPSSLLPCYTRKRVVVYKIGE